MNRLLLVRHGENKANLTKEFSHRGVDYPLTPKGRLQAEQTAEHLERFAVSRVYTSPLLRAEETAEIIAAAVNAPLETLEAFREVAVGDLEGQPPTKAAWAEHDAIIGAWLAGDGSVRFRGGENFLELTARVREGYRVILEGRDGETLVLVAHGGSLGLPLSPLLSLSSSGLDRAALRSHPNCGVSELNASFENGVLTLELLQWASAEHLHGEAANLVSATPDADDL